MSYLNNIIHPEKNIAEKVNFFADYYNFVASQIENSDYLDVENYLSLMEKIIFQIDTNLENCPKYIDSYLTHPLIQKKNKYFIEYKNYLFISELFETYKKQRNKKLKLKWIKENPNFKTSLNRFKIELKKVMFKKSLKEIISFLKCIHNVSEHKDDLLHHTNILVSEFILTNRAKDDIVEIFSKIITRNINDFPFPNSFLKENKENLETAKKEYIENRTFDQQFEGIFHFFKEKINREYFIFRIYNIKSKLNFKFRYDKVTFYHPKNIRLKKIFELIKKDHFFKDFFDEENMIMAVVKVNAFSDKIAKQLAVNTIEKELHFLDYKCKSNSLFEKYSYLRTTNFNNATWSWSRKENSHPISEWDEKSLENNPFKRLNKINNESKQHFLNYEALFIKAEISRNAEDYWHYFETLFKVYSKSTVEIISLLSTLLSKNNYNNEKNIIENYILNLVINSTSTQLGLTNEQYRNLKYSRNHNFSVIKEKVNHPFIKFLFEKKSKINNLDNVKYLKSFYSRTLWECYSQRNSMIHNNQNNEKALIQIDFKIPNLTSRIRTVLIDSIIKSNKSTFLELIESLK